MQAQNPARSLSIIKLNQYEIHITWLRSDARGFFMLLLTIGIFSASFSSIILVPYHDVIQFPNYWYELIFPGIFGFCGTYTSLFILQANIIFEYPTIMNLKIVPTIFLSSASIFIVSHFVIYLTWSVLLIFYAPMPFTGIIDIIFACLVGGFVFWNYVSKNLPRLS